MNTTRAETASRFNTYLPHLKRMTESASTECLIYYPHHIIPKLNQLHTANPPAFRYRLSQLTATPPTPIGRPSHLAGLHVDPVAELPLRKDKHLTSLNQLHNRHDNFSNQRQYKRVKRNLVNQPNVDLNIVREFAEELERDPDPFFSGTYDWYCTGSTMAVVDEWLVHVENVGGHLNRLKLSQLTVARNGSVQLMPCADFAPITNALAEHGHIYEVLLCTGLSANRLCVRQKHRISIVDVGGRRLVQHFSSTVPFVSAAFDADAEHIIATDVLRCVRVWALDGGDGANVDQPLPVHSAAITSQYKRTDLTDPWTCVRPFDAHVQVLCDRETLRLFDTRIAFDAGTQPSYAHTFRSYMERCEQITCVGATPAAGRRTNCVLVGTSHKMFSLDVRMAGDLGQASADVGDRRDLILWTHQLQCLPTMIATIDCDEGGGGDGEFIAIGSHMAGEVRLCETQRSRNGGGHFVAETMPYKPPSMWDSYRVVRRHGECLDARCRVPQQLRTSVTGMQLWRPAAGAIHVLQQNSAGDVFVQQMQHRAVDGTSRSVAAMETALNQRRVRKAFGVWDAELQRLARGAADAPNDGDDKNDDDDDDHVAGDHARTFYATDLTYFRAMADVVARNVCNPFGVGGSGMVDTAALPAGTAATDADRCEQRPRWQQPLRKLRTYVDALAPSMLEIWQMPEQSGLPDDGTAAVGTSASATSARSKADRIAAWLERTSTQTDAGGAAGDATGAAFDVSLSTIHATQERGGVGVVGATERMAVVVEEELKEEEVKVEVPQQVPLVSQADGVRPAETAHKRTVVPETWDDTHMTSMMEMTLDDATQLMEDTMRTTASGRPPKKKAARKVRAFVPGF